MTPQDPVVIGGFAFVIVWVLVTGAHILEIMAKRKGWK